MADPTPITAIASAISEFSKLLAEWIKSAEKRKLEACKEAAEGYIFASEKEGIYKDLPDDKRKKYMEHFKKRFFAYN